MALQTKDFSVTGISAGGGITYTYILRVTQNSTNMTANSSNLTVQAILKQNYTGTAFHTWYTGVSCSLNGSEIFSDYVQRSLSGTAEHVYYTWTGDIPHNADGKLTLQVSGSFWQSVYEEFSPPEMTIPVGSMVLQAISRSSAIQAEDAKIGEEAVITVTPGADNFRHSIAYQFGDEAGYVTQTGSTSQTEVIFRETEIRWLLPEKFYYQLSDRLSDTCTLTCRTYSGSVLIGSQRCQFRVRGNTLDCRLQMDARVEDVNEKTLALTGDPFMLIRYHSTARCMPNLQAQYGATVTVNRVNDKKINGEYRDMEKVEINRFTFYAEDSRGSAQEQIVEVPMMRYTKLSCEPRIQRLSDAANEVLLELTGSYYIGHFGNMENTLTVNYRINSRDWVPIPVEIAADGSFSATVQIGNLDYGTAYTLTVAAEDCLERVSKKLPVQQGLPLFNWNKESFEFHIPVACSKGVSGAYFVSVQMQGGTSFRFRSCFPGWDQGGRRQTVLLVGNRADTPVMGTILVAGKGGAVWSGTQGVVISTQQEGAVTVDVGASCFDRFLLISPDVIESL